MNSPNTKAKELMAFVPQTFPLGKREINIADPAGVCWHIGVNA